MPDNEEAISASIGGLGCLVMLACGLLQVGGAFALFHDYFEWNAFVASFVVFLLLWARAGLLICIGGFLGLWLGWEWPWYWSAAASFPTVAIMIAVAPMLLLGSLFTKSEPA